MEIVYYDISNNQSLFNAKCVVTHELGHALGYFNHTNNNDYGVMNASYSTEYVQNAEKQHLKQIYDNFYP